MLEAVGPVYGCRLIDISGNRLQRTDIDNHVVTHKPPKPYRSQRKVNNPRIAQPAGFQRTQSHQVEQSIQRTVGGVEYKLKHKSNGNAIHNKGQKQNHPEKIASLQLSVQDDGKQQRCDILDDAYQKIRNLMQKYPEYLRVPEYLGIVVPANQLFVGAEPIPIGKAQVNQLDSRIKCKGAQQGHRNQQKSGNNQPFLSFVRQCAEHVGFLPSSEKLLAEAKWITRSPWIIHSAPQSGYIFMRRQD
ncbi:hypothetical protein D3C75_689330 [compost metagenome]